MSMFGHNHVRPKMEAVLAASTLNRFDQPFPASLFAQERLPPKAREGQRVSVAGSVVALAGLSMDHGSSRPIIPSMIPAKRSMDCTEGRNKTLATLELP